LARAAGIIGGYSKADDVILTMGAGNVGQIATQLPELLTEALKSRDLSSLTLLA